MGGKSETRLWPSVNVQAAGQSCYWESPQQATNAHLAQSLGSNPGTTQGPACLLAPFLQLYNPASCFPSPLQLYVEVRAQKDPARGVSFETKNSLS